MKLKLVGHYTTMHNDIEGEAGDYERMQENSKLYRKVLLSFGIFFIYIASVISIVQ